jgi:tryptophan 2,3-dioxygenase
VKVLEQRKVTLLELHQNPNAHFDLYLLSEGLLNLDEWFVIFREHHLQLVKHIIGGNVPSLRGVHASGYLEHEMKERFYPELWEVRNQLSHKWGLPPSATARDGHGSGCPFHQ